MNDWLKDWRDSLGWSQTRAARELEVPTDTYHRWEHGKIKIRHAMMLRLACDQLSAMACEEISRFHPYPAEQREQ